MASLQPQASKPPYFNFMSRCFSTLYWRLVISNQLLTPLASRLLASQRSDGGYSKGYLTSAKTSRVTAEPAATATKGEDEP